jgi:hypothetical protein
LVTAGLVSLSSITKTGSNGVGNIGAADSTFNTIFAKATSAQYADVAEKYQADADYPPGTVLIFGGDHEVTASGNSHSNDIAGVVSTDPAYIMNSSLESDHVATVALLGRVPCQVVGQIRKGQCVVASNHPGTATALDRINVARLVAFIRARLNQIGKTFVFEPNDQITRNEITNAITGLMTDLVAKRGIYDYLVVCDLSNNTPARIDRNELYVDIAIEPVKAVEFIYIPVRLKNTGEIAAGNVASSAAT